MRSPLRRLSLIILLAAIFGLQYSHASARGAKLGLQSDEPATQSSPAKDDNPFVSAAGTPAETAPADARGWAYDALTVLGRLLLAVMLSAILAFRPRQDAPLFKRSLFVSQTQILLSVVAAALMMIVGDNTARAFAIFAAVSLVRFRTNIRDPKEISVLLISLALGLATGVGRPDLAVILCIFVLVVLWILEHFESQQVFRTMDLKVVTKNIETTQNA